MPFEKLSSFATAVGLTPYLAERAISRGDFGRQVEIVKLGRNKFVQRPQVFLKAPKGKK